MGIRIKERKIDFDVTTYQKKCGMGIVGLQEVCKERSINLQITFTKSMHRWSIYIWGQKFVGVGETGFTDACRGALEFTLNIMDNEALTPNKNGHQQ